MKVITDCLKVDKNDAESFFYIFARSEYALKASNFLENKNYASADWQAFAKKTRTLFDANKSNEIKEAVEYLKNHPPKKQVNANGHLEWRDSPLDKNTPITHYLVTMICRIRNNLFHGGKFAHGSSEEISRDTKLIKHAIIILCELMELDDEVKHYFHQPLYKTHNKSFEEMRTTCGSS